MRHIPIALILAFCAAPAIAQDSGGDEVDHAAMGHDGMEMSVTADDPVIAAWQKINADMHAGMSIEFTGDPDVDFMRGMIAHHQGAVEMAKVVLEHGSDPEVRALAEAIIAAQVEEIAMMEAWLAARGE
jgi:uncharacterized protein (DUF305 family)